jgi:hypothetical protein
LTLIRTVVCAWFCFYSYYILIERQIATIKFIQDFYSKLFKAFVEKLSHLLWIWEKTKHIKNIIFVKVRKFINDFFPGKNVANPTAMLLSSAQMLEHIGLRKVINKKEIF